MLYQQVFDTIDELNDTYLNVWEDVCNLESPTACKEAVDAVGDYFIRMAESRGWQVEVLPLENAGNPICITLNPEAEAKPVTLSGHIDTVHPIGLFGTPAVRRDETRIYGPGVTDCKGGVVASFLAMDALARCGFTARPVQLIIQTDEETGSKTSGKRTVEFMCEKAKDSVAFLNTEAVLSGKKVVLERKGILRYQITVHGKAAHSSLCDQGANAITEAAKKILKLEMMKDPKGITCNCGVIHGGTVANTVAAECSFTVDIRYPDEKAYETAVQTVQEVVNTNETDGCTATLELVSTRPAMPWREVNAKLVDRVNEIFKKSGLPQVEATSSLGGSDAAYATLAGIPCIDNFGTAGGSIHSANEYGELYALAESAKWQAAVAIGL